MKKIYDPNKIKKAVNHSIYKEMLYSTNVPLFLLAYAPGEIVAAPWQEQPCFGSVSLVDDLKDAYEKELLDSVELVGICTDICVVSNALMIKSALPELPVYVDASCCAGVTPEKHKAALEVMESCQVIVTGKDSAL